MVIVTSEMKNKEKKRKSKAERRAEARARTAEEQQQLVAGLKAKDPAFDLQRFLSDAKTIFTRLQDGWFARDLTPVRPFLSDATFQRFNVQLQLMAQQGVRDAIADLRVLDVQLVDVDQNEWFDTAHVRIHARLRDTDVKADASDEEALAAARQANPETFTEVWSFVRKPGAQTKEGAIQGKCPNCGGPFQGGATNTCEYCGAVVNSGNYSWTLAEITQGGEYSHENGAKPPAGLAELRQADPGLSLQVVEDRASLVFWKWIEAQSRAEPKRLAKLCTPELLADLEAQTEQGRRDGQRLVFLDCAVGAVKTRRFSRQGDADQAEVVVRWSSRTGLAPEGGPTPELGTQSQRRVFTLRRKAGATTPTANGMSTHRCPQCNAALTDSDSPSCDYCGTPLSSGERDWVLAGTYSLSG
ncbi:MAG TPA: TIM44-like domain-containing protein [Myxococcaceae bacterium]|nr:TIM44-like domain-containing protein [Myxococcaceae bacterium]